MGYYDRKGYPDYMIQVIKYMYEGTSISIDIGINISQKMELINQGVRQGCLFSPTLFIIYIYIYEGKSESKVPYFFT
jgi:hypothetical protein